MAATLTAEQQRLAATMRVTWARFTASSNPSSHGLRWPSFSRGAPVQSFVEPRPQLVPNSAAEHHCSFWATG